MTRKWFFISTVLAIAAVAVFVSNQITQAQRPDRSEMRDRQGGGRRGGGGRFSPTSLIDGSWADLTFTVNVDDETLLKARPIYQKYRDNLEKAVNEARESGDFQAIRGMMTEIREGFTAERNAILTDEHASQLEAIEGKRMQQMMRRGGRPDGGGERAGGGRRR